MAKIKAKVYLYREKDGSYSCCIDDKSSSKLNYGLVGEGATAQQAKEDWFRSYDDMKRSFAEGKRGAFVEADFSFLYDLPSMLSYYAGKFSYAGLARITGVSAAQLSQYASGYRSASPATTKKIQAALHAFGEELSQVALV